MIKKLLPKFLFLLVVVSAVSCGGGGGGGGGTIPPQNGLARISIISDFQSATRTVPGYADSLRVTIVPPDGVTLPVGIPNPFILNRSNRNRILDDLSPSAQPYVFNMEALTNNNVVGTATRSIIAEENKTREVDVSANLDSQIASVTVEGVNSLNAGQNTQFTAFAKNSQGATLFSGNGFAWTSSGNNVLSVNPNSGVANASALGNVTVTATLKDSVISGSKQIVVNSSGGVTISIFPTSAAVNTGGNQQFNATVSGAGNTAVAWSITPVGQAGAVSGSGLYTASNNEGLYYVQATSLADPTAKAEAIVSVAAPGSQYRVVYKSTFDINENIWMCTLAGTQFQRLTDDPRREFEAELSRDGTKLAFTRLAPEAGGFGWGNDLWVKNLSTGVETQLTFSNPGNGYYAVTSPTWSANGQQIYYTVVVDGGDTEIHRVDVNGANRIPIIDSAGGDASPSISPDGTKLTFVSSRTALSDLFFANLDGSNQQGSNLPDMGGINAPPAWSPDGTRIALLGSSTIKIVNSSTKAVVDTIQPPVMGDSLAYTPDGQSLLVGWSDLWAIRLSDKVGLRITDRSGDILKIKLGSLN